jgi:mono/diheme cytochrome c family protein
VVSRILISAVLFLSASAVSAFAQDNAGLIEDGRAIAVTQCGSCHALDHEKRSPRADAPAFRKIAKRYRFPVLAEELMEGIKLGHPDMPQFQLAPRGVDSLIAYLRSIQENPKRAKKPKS